LIAAGVVLVILGLMLGRVVLYALGLVLLVAGVILWALRTLGRPVAGRRHYY
jgi:hypothetical protein